MCVPGCYEVIEQRLSRRNFLKTGAAALGTLAVSGCTVTLKSSSANRETATTKTFERAVDLTHTLSPKFPTFGGKPLISMEPFSKLKKDGYTTYNIKYFELIGTHIDAPIHFSDEGLSVDKIPVSKLVVPLAVIDIRERAAANPDTQLTPDDVKAWEAKHGLLPQGGAVAMNSGWDANASSEKFRNADSNGVMHFPGFHPETIDLLLRERSIEGILVDTLSLDYGASKDFAVHYHWLPQNKWGIECTANLSSVPATGATVVVGAPTIEGGTGGPSRVLALV